MWRVLILYYLCLPKIRQFGADLRQHVAEITMKELYEIRNRRDLLDILTSSQISTPEKLERINNSTGILDIFQGGLLKDFDFDIEHHMYQS
jgi:hypothetical protein|uniref:Uncharacterized protein n=1 Tax=viral metagenome TaxID=1070528 RepID=A0A6C0DY91_9ZZZZ